MKSILIIGLGRFGRHCARKLNEMGHQVMAVDMLEERVDAVLPYVTDGLIGNSTRVDFMQTAERIKYLCKTRLSVTPNVAIVAINTLPRSEKKTQRVFDHRGD